MASQAQLPPFAALRAFHAAASHGRYRDAADSLGITESAVSHQIRKLEDFLRVKLFEKAGVRTQLTETGRRYYEQIDPAIRQIHAATEAVLPRRGRSVVRLTLPTSLAATWLIPKLGAFERMHTDIDLQLVPTTRVIDLKRDQVDMAVRHGRGHWQDVDAEFLLEEWAMPVCAPEYLTGHTENPSAETLKGLRLIVNGGVPDEWEEWARARGIGPIPSDSAITLDSMEQALQVAESGHGLAMGRRPGVDERLARGTLVPPFGGPSPTGAGYYLCRPSGLAPTTPERRLLRWLKDLADEWHQAIRTRPTAPQT